MGRRSARKSFRKTVIYIVTLAAFTIVSVVAGGGAGSGDDSIPGSFTITLKFPGLEIRRADHGAVRLSMEGYPSTGEPGMPSIPSRCVTLAVPPGMRASSVRMVRCDRRAVAGKHLVEWGQPPVPAGGLPLTPAAPDAGVYGSDSPYPAEPVSLDGTGMMREISVARIRVTPVRYLPESGKVEVCRSIKITVKCSPGAETDCSGALETLSGQVAAELIENMEQAESWYEVAGESGSGTARDADIADYVIITGERLVQSTERLRSYKESLGLSVKTVTTEWIYANCSGPDNPEKIRNFLQERYLSWGIDYVLLVGGDASIPMRRCYTPFNFSPWYWDYIPTDYYYCDLSGTWDRNGDGKYGQWYVDDWSGGVDFYSEVFVGRIPCDDPELVSSICDKIVDYQQDTGEWKHRALLLGAVTNFKNDPFILLPATYNSGLMEELKENILEPLGYPSTTMYEKEYLAPDPTPCDRPLTRQNVTSEWAQGYGIVTWACHGSPNGAYRYLWTWDDGDNIPEKSEIQTITFFERSDVALLDEERPGIVFGAACSNSRPDVPCLMSDLLQQGASATIGSTGVTLGELGWDEKDDGGMQSLDYYFWKYLLLDRNSVGEALRLSTARYKDNYCWYPILGYINLYEYNLYGDPSMKVDAEENPQVVEGIDPAFGPAGAEVTITGSRFGAERGSSRVTFNGVPVSEYAHWSDDEIRCTVPAGVSGLSYVKVITDAGTSGRKRFSVMSVKSITPASGFANLPVVINNLAGTDFQNGAKVWLEREGTTVRATNVIRFSSTGIFCTIDLKNAATGAYDVVVRNPDGSEARLYKGFMVKACGAGSTTSVMTMLGVLGLLSIAGYSGSSRKIRRFFRRR